MIIPLHIRSQHSWCLGTASPGELVARAAQHGLSALALTDVDNLHGQPHFQELCRNAGIRPILGVELRRPGSLTGRLVLLAKNADGYANICRIISVRRGGAGTEREWQAAQDPVHALGGDARGLFVMSDDPIAIERLFGMGVVDRANLRLLLVRPSQRDERPVRECAARLGVPLVADPEIAVLDPDDRIFAALLVAALGNRRITELAASELAFSHSWFRSPARHAKLFADLPQAIEETERVAEQCRFELVRGRPVLPGADAVGGIEPELALERRCRQALANGTYAARLADELSIICELGYASYFLIAAEILDFAKQRNIAIAARGSAVGSLVVHLLGLSPIDPVAHGLYFERFLHAGRKSPPDIDLDVCSHRRDELIRWVVGRFGRERTALVGTMPTFQLDSAMRSGHKALSKSSPLIARLIGKPRSLAMHPGGIVVAGGPISSYVPIELGRAGLGVAQYDRHWIEKTGLTKLDLLGNRFLSQLQRARALSRGAAPRLHECPLDDPATLARIDRADTLGCFQIETPLLRSLLRQIPVRSLEDCVTALALVRPGASAGAAKRDYLRGKRPPIYDEDLLELLSEGAGISVAMADELRARIIAHRDEVELAELGRAYLRQAEQNRRDPSRARATWNRAVEFAAYSFSKAHAWSFALLAYQSAYFKTHYLAEFGCALLDDYGGAYPLRTIAADLQRSGAVIAVPSVNRSSLASTLGTRPHSIQLGLARVKHLRKRTAMAIIEVRERRGDYASLGELTEHVRLAPRELAALVACGAFDELAGVDRIQWTKYDALVRIRSELHILEMHVTDHPMRVLRDEARRHGCISLARVHANIDRGAGVRFAGLLAASRRHRTPAGQEMEYLTFEDETGLLNAVITTRAHPRLASVVTTPGPYLAEGRLCDDHGHRFVELTSLRPFYERLDVTQPRSTSCATPGRTTSHRSTASHRRSRSHPS